MKSARPGLEENVRWLVQMPESNATVGIYDGPAGVQAVVEQLQWSGFDLKNLSIAARDDPNGKSVTGYYSTGDRIRYWGSLGAFWGTLWGLLAGWAFLSIPDIGPVVVAGPLAGWIIAGLENQAIFAGLSAVGAGLYSIGIPRLEIAVFEEALRAGKYLLLAHGSASEVAKAKKILAFDKPREATA